MRGTPVWIVAGIVLWLVWCAVSVQYIVPAVHRHITFYWPVLAFLFCLLPLIVGSAILVARMNKSASK